MTWGGKREGSGAKPKPRLTAEEVQALIQEQAAYVLCARNLAVSADLLSISTA